MQYHIIYQKISIHSGIPQLNFSEDNFPLGFEKRAVPLVPSHISNAASKCHVLALEVLTHLAATKTWRIWAYNQWFLMMKNGVIDGYSML